MFAEKMRMLRRSHNMTQAELAEQLGLSASAVGMYEQGRREPELSVIKQLCLIFGVPADTLLDTPSQPEQSSDIKDLIQDLSDRLLAAEELTLDGTPISLHDIHRLIDAIEVSTAVVLDRVEREQSSQ